MGSRPLIVEIHLQIRASSWPTAGNEIKSRLENADPSYRLTPLYFTYDIEDTELRICFQVEDPAKLEKFVVDEIRLITGVYGTRARLTLNGEIFPAGITTLAEGNNSLRSSHVFLKIDPQKDRRVWEALLQLKGNGETSPTWIFRDFYEYDRDVTLRLVGRSDTEIRNYIERFVGPIDGILLWRLQFMHGVTQILSKEKLLALAQQWMSG